ncbi:MAG: bifunctional diguanylate cyclase/phosphodiesterase [Myxococcota bacterium]
MLLPGKQLLIVASRASDVEHLSSLLGTSDGLRWVRPEAAAAHLDGADLCVWVRRASQPLGHLSVTTPTVIIGDGVDGVESLSWARLDAAALAQAMGRAMGQMTPPDPVTGLPGRQRFLSHTQITLALLRSIGRPMQAAMILLDLDDFATVNDSLGHLAGDAVLRTLTGRLTETLRKHDLLARVGADEFAILLLGDHVREMADAVADRLAAVMAAPIGSGDRELYLSASLGIAICEDGSASADRLLRSADIALRCAKRQGRGGRVRYVNAMQEEVRARFELESDIQRALQRREFILYYQPVVSASSGKVVSFEALVRWPHQTRGLVSPGQFLPLAEQTGLILPLSWQLLTRACREAASWTARDAPSVSVNLAAAQLVSPELLPRLRRALEDSRLPPHRLKLEITESCLIDERRLPTDLFEQLAEMGLEIHLDDFGTGYSSLSYLERFPLHGLKIDRSFVRCLIQDRRRRAITQRLIDLGADLDMTVIAEGVETLEELSCLRGMNCELIQGYYFARPMPLQEIPAFFDAHARRAS